MTHYRKTTNEYHLMINYGKGWEHELTELSQYIADRRKEEYAISHPQCTTKVVVKHVPKPSWNAFNNVELRAIINQSCSSGRDTKSAQECLKHRLPDYPYVDALVVTYDHAPNGFMSQHMFMAYGHGGITLT